MRPNQPKYRTTSASLSDDQLARLEREARERGVTKSAVLRTLVDTLPEAQRRGRRGRA